jgi:hypothetical protein
LAPEVDPAECSCFCTLEGRACLSCEKHEQVVALLNEVLAAMVDDELERVYIRLEPEFFGDET